MEEDWIAEREQLAARRARVQRSLKKVKTGLGFALRAAAAGAFDQRKKQTEEWH